MEIEMLFIIVLSFAAGMVSSVILDLLISRWIQDNDD